MQQLVWLLVAALIVVHQDNWFWENGYLVFGFMPIGLFFHACISIAAGIVWYLATLYCWPEEMIESVVEETGARP